MNNAEKHEIIAKAVYPNAEVLVMTPRAYRKLKVGSNYLRIINEDKTCFVNSVLLPVSDNFEFPIFDLLELSVHDFDMPTQQAKASAFDVVKSKWFQNQIYKNDGKSFEECNDVVPSLFDKANPCEAIFNAAWEIVKP